MTSTGCPKRGSPARANSFFGATSALEQRSAKNVEEDGRREDGQRDVGIPESEERGRGHRGRSPGDLTREPVDEALVCALRNEAPPTGGVGPEERHASGRRGHRQTQDEDSGVKAVVVEVLGHECRGVRDEGDEHKEHDVSEKEGPVDVADEGHVGVMIDPPDADEEEGQRVRAVLGPGVREGSAQPTAGCVGGHVEDQESGRNREDAVREGLEAALAQGSRRARSDRGRAIDAPMYSAVGTTLPFSSILTFIRDPVLAGLSEPGAQP